MTPEIHLDEDVWEFMKRNAEPFVDSPSDVLRRLLGMSYAGATAANGEVERESARSSVARKKSRQRRPRPRHSEVPRAVPGTILPDDEYDLPILSILADRDGRAATREVLDELGERLSESLLPADHETLTSGDIRWRNRAQFVRLRLIQSGDMKRDSPRGVWEITDQGRQRVVSQ